MSNSASSRAREASLRNQVAALSGALRSSQKQSYVPKGKFLWHSNYNRQNKRLAHYCNFFSRHKYKPNISARFNFSSSNPGFSRIEAASLKRKPVINSFVSSAASASSVSSSSSFPSLVSHSSIFYSQSKSCLMLNNVPPLEALAETKSTDLPSTSGLKTSAKTDKRIFLLQQQIHCLNLAVNKKKAKAIKNYRNKLLLLKAAKRQYNINRNNFKIVYSTNLSYQRQLSLPAGTGIKNKLKSVANKKQTNLIFCKFFNKFGKCSNEKCKYYHNVELNKICPMYLKGLCPIDNCLAKHDGIEVPVCGKFLKGLCIKGPECKYRHIFLSEHLQRIYKEKWLQKSRKNKLINGEAVANNKNVAVSTSTCAARHSESINNNLSTALSSTLFEEKSATSLEEKFPISLKNSRYYYASMSNVETEETSQEEFEDMYIHTATHTDTIRIPKGRFVL